MERGGRGVREVEPRGRKVQALRLRGFGGLPHVRERSGRIWPQAPRYAATITITASITATEGSPSNWSDQNKSMPRRRLVFSGWLTFASGSLCWPYSTRYCATNCQQDNIASYFSLPTCLPPCLQATYHCNCISRQQWCAADPQICQPRVGWAAGTLAFGITTSNFPVHLAST